MKTSEKKFQKKQKNKQIKFSDIYDVYLARIFSDEIFVHPHIINQISSTVRVQLDLILLGFFIFNNAPVCVLIKCR